LKQIVTWVMPDVETTYGGDDEEDDPLPGETDVVTITTVIATNTTSSHYGKRSHGKITRR